MFVEDLDEFGKIHKRARKTVNFVHNDDVDLASLDISQELFQCWTFHVAAGEAAIIVMGFDGILLTASGAVLRLLERANIDPHLDKSCESIRTKIRNVFFALGTADKKVVEASSGEDFAKLVNHLVKDKSENNTVLQTLQEIMERMPQNDTDQGEAIRTALESIDSRIELLHESIKNLSERWAYHLTSGQDLEKEDSAEEEMAPFMQAPPTTSSAASPVPDIAVLEPRAGVDADGG